MDKKELIITGVIIVVVAVIAAAFMLSPSDSQQTSKITILNKNTIGENGTIYIKLTDKDSISLGGKTVHVSVVDENNTAVFNSDVQTQFTGVALVKLNNLSDGEYTVNVTFDGDANYTASSFSKKLTIGDGIEEEDLSNITEEIDDTSLDSPTTTQSQSSSSQYSQSSGSQSYSSSQSSSYSSSSSSSQSSSSESSEDTYYDENGKAVEPIIDENGHETFDI